LQIGTNGTTGALGAGNITNNASLIYNLSSANTLANLISGTGTFPKRGSGKLTLSNSNTYTGATTIDGGNLSLASPSYQPLRGTIIVNNGGTLSFGGYAYYNQLGGFVAGATNPFTPVIVNSGGVVDSSGTVTSFTNLVLNGGTLSATGGFSSVWG
jgi:autotransporter-associated beta strand protein